MLHPQTFLHPEDAAALRNMEAIPGFSAVVKSFLKHGYEQLYHGLNMASKIRLSPTQLPEVYNRLPPICEKMGIPVPEFYLEMNPMPNAYTFGDTKIFITATSGLLEYLDDDEINSVLAHECGHILCRHVLYHSMAQMILTGGNFMGALGSLLAPMKYALLYWYRRSELSADRAAAAVLGVDNVVKTQVRLAGGSKAITAGINLEEWASQADEYEKIRGGKTWDKLLQSLAVMEETHPFASVRVREIMLWGKTDQYKNISESLAQADASKTLCPACAKLVEKGWEFCKYCGAKQ